MHGSIMMFLFVGPVRLRPGQLPGAAADRRARHGVPPAQRPVVLAVPGRRAHDGVAASSPPAAPPTSAGPPTRRCRTPSAPRAPAPTCGSSASCVTGVAHVLAAVNIITTVICLRAPGMTMFRMPIFTWNMLVVERAGAPGLPGAHRGLALLFADRHLGGHFFDAAEGGEPVLWQHLFWFFGHPEVYIVALPFFGVVTEVIPVFSRRPLFGYKGFVFATLAIAALSIGVWAHHMFATGAVQLAVLLGAVVPDRGADRREDLQLDRHHVAGPAHASRRRCCSRVGFLLVFLVGGLTGVMLAVAAGRLPRPRHLLRRRPHALRAVRAAGLRLLRRALLLVPEVHRPLLARGPGQAALLADVRRLQPDVPGPAPARACGACPGGSPTTSRRTGWTTLNLLSTRRRVPSSARRRARVPRGTCGARCAHGDAGRATTRGAGTRSSGPRRRRRPPHNFDALPPIRSERPVFDATHPEHDRGRGRARRPGGARRRPRGCREGRGRHVPRLHRPFFAVIGARLLVHVSYEDAGHGAARWRGAARPPPGRVPLPPVAPDAGRDAGRPARRRPSPTAPGAVGEFPAPSVWPFVLGVGAVVLATGDRVRRSGCCCSPAACSSLRASGSSAVRCARAAGVPRRLQDDGRRQRRARTAATGSLVVDVAPGRGPHDALRARRVRWPAAGRGSRAWSSWHSRYGERGRDDRERRRQHPEARR